MASERKDRALFEEDEVSIIEGGIYKCGLVLENAEYVSSDDDEEDENDDLFEKVTAGTVRVAWHPEGTEEVVQEAKLTLEDRSLVPGDVVRQLIEGEDSQRGYVTSTRVLCHVQVLGTNYVIKNVDSRDLLPLQNWEIDPGDVYLDSWVGKIETVTEMLHVSLPDGTSFKVDSDEGVNIFDDASEKRNIDSEFYSVIFYEGQYVKAMQKDLHRLVKKEHPKYQWPKKKGNVEYICRIDKIEVKKIEVHWLCHGCAEDESFDAISSPPPSKLRKEQIARLRSLDCFAASSTELGDKTKYTIKPDDVILTMDTNKPFLHCILRGHQGTCDVGDKNEKNLLKNSPVNGICADTSSNDGDSAGEHSLSPADTLNHVSHDINNINGHGDDKSEPEINSVTKASLKSGIVEDGVKDVGSNHDTQDENSKECNTNDGSDSQSKKQQGSTTESMPSEALDNDFSANEEGASVDNEPITEKDTSKTKPLFLRGIHCKTSDKHETYGSVVPVPKPKPGDTVPVEVLYTVSYIDVMWQDGSTEKNILSSVLYPIHHLDELEFFPGDYVISSSVDADPDCYGVVESVQHRERTCMVHWMNTSNRLAENIEPEEMSVYDIKDHPEYRFRPGHVVVRVGGYEAGALPSEAVAGQVYELGKDGRILVQWADGKQSHCYPQDLYLIENEFSELNDSLDDSASEEDGSEDSWITEEETEIDAGNTEGVKGNSTVLFIEASQKTVLDQIMDRALSGLQQLQEIFNQALIKQQPASIARILEELLRIHQQCRLLDKTLKTSYFRDPKLTLAIQGVKSMLDKEREERMVKKARDLYHANTGKVIAPPTSEKFEHSGSVRAKSAPATTSTDQEESSNCDEPDQNTSEPDKSGEDSTSDEDTSEDSESSEEEKDRPLSEDLAILALLQEFLDMDVETKELLESIRGKPSEASPDIETDKEKSDNNTSWWIKYLDETSIPPGLLVSRMVCRCLQTQLGKVLSDLTEKWEELKKCGKLKVLNDTEDDDGDSVDHDVKPSDEDVDKNEGSSVDPEDITSESTKSNGASNRAQLQLHLNPSSQEKNMDIFQSPMTPQTPADIRAKIDFNKEGFTVEEEAPTTHRFYSSENEQRDPKAFSAAVRKEMKMLKTGLPRGIYVKGFSNRMDLYSVMMLGPSSTPYEDGLFFFEMQLPNDYPNTPPHVHYVSFCSDKLNPNLYVDGKVCVSLLGTWIGKGSEVWTSNSSLLQLLISIQGLVLVSEPYYNEAGYEKQKGTQHGYENSRMYNEMVLLKVVESMTTLCTNPPEVFKQEARNHIRSHAPRMIRRLEYWLDKASETTSDCDDQCSSASVTDKMHYLSMDDQSDSVSRQSGNQDVYSLPDFPLFPLSRGFRITLKKLLSQYKKTLSEHGYCDTST